MSNISNIIDLIREIERIPVKKDYDCGMAKTYPNYKEKEYLDISKDELINIIKKYLDPNNVNIKAPVMECDKVNRNNTVFSKEAIEKALDDIIVTKEYHPCSEIPKTVEALY